VISPGRGFG